MDVDVAWSGGILPSFFRGLPQLPRQLFQVAMRNAVCSIYGVIFDLEGNRTGKMQSKKYINLKNM